MIVTGTFNRCLWIVKYQALCQAIQEVYYEQILTTWIKNKNKTLNLSFNCLMQCIFSFNQIPEIFIIVQFCCVCVHLSTEITFSFFVEEKHSFHSAASQSHSDFQCFSFKFSNNMVLKVGIQFNNKVVETKVGNIHRGLL